MTALLKIIILYLTVIVSILRFLDWSLPKETKTEIGDSFKSFAHWLDNAKPMEWLAVLLGKLNNKKAAIFIGIILIIYTASRLAVPNQIRILSEKGLLNAENIAAFCIGTCISLAACARLLAPLIQSKKYARLVPIFIVSLGLYFLTGHLVQNSLYVNEMLTSKNLSIVKGIIVNIIVFIYGCILWTAILSVLSIILFFGIYLFFILLSWLLRLLSRAALWFISKDGRYAYLVLVLGSCLDLVDILIKKGDAEEARKEVPAAPSNSPDGRVDTVHAKK